MYHPTALDHLPDEPTVSELRAFLPTYIADEVIFDGWNDIARDAAAAAHGVTQPLAMLAFGDGAMGMIEAWIGHIDAKMIAAFPPDRIAGMKIRARITELVWFRIETIAPQREALRRAQAIMALPQNLPRALKIGWRSADLMWRLAGDKATDYNHYSKRAILSGVYASSLLAFLGDESENFAETRAFLERRIDNVMQFEKTKAGMIKRRETMPDPIRFLARLRYPLR